MLPTCLTKLYRDLHVSYTRVPAVLCIHAAHMPEELSGG